MQDLIDDTDNCFYINFIEITVIKFKEIFNL